MKKRWQHVNRGILLLLAVIIAVVSYLVSDSIHNSRERKEVKEIASQYIIDSYPLFITPSDFDFFFWNSIDSDTLLPAVHSQAGSLSHYFADNELVRNQAFDQSFDFFRYYSSLKMRPDKCTRVPESVEILELYNGSASVVVRSTTKIDFINEDGTITYEELATQDDLQFLYTDGEWKLVQTKSNLNIQSGYEF